MMHRHRGDGSGFPRPGCDLEDLYRLWGLPAANEIEAFTDVDVPGFKSRDVLSRDLEHVPPPGSGLLRSARAPSNGREDRREHTGCQDSCLIGHTAASIAFDSVRSSAFTMVSFRGLASHLRDNALSVRRIDPPGDYLAG
jgi:hypothetical protein